MNEQRKMKILAGVMPTPIQAITEAYDISKAVREAFDAVAALNTAAIDADLLIDNLFKFDTGARDKNSHQTKEADRIFKSIEADVKKLQAMIRDEANKNK